jgi:hypothetical protein
MYEDPAALDLDPDLAKALLRPSTEAEQLRASIAQDVRTVRTLSVLSAICAAVSCALQLWALAK